MQFDGCGLFNQFTFCYICRKFFALKKHRGLLIAGSVVWFIITVVLMTLPGSTLPKSHFFDVIHMDKWVHIGMFSILVYLVLLGINAFSANSSAAVLLLVPLAGVAYGTAMEFVQKYWVSNRSFDLWDIVADSVGCFLAYGFFRWQRNKAKAAGR